MNYRLTRGIILGCILAVLMPRCGFGAGTPAGTVLSNQATVSFRFIGDLALTTVSSNVVTITVAQVAAVNMVPVSATQVTHINSIVDYPFSIVNVGNGPDRFTFVTISSLGLSGQVYRDNNADGVLSVAEAAAGPVGATSILPADSLAFYVVRLAVPDNAALIGQTDAMTLTASSQFDPIKRATIYRSTVITAAVVEVRKSVSNTIPRAGDRVTYTLTYANTGNAEATAMTITDLLDLRLRYVTGSAAPAPDSAAGQVLRWTFSSIPAGARSSITFQVDIINTVTAGTEIHNMATDVYNDGQNLRSVTSTELNFMTIQSNSFVTVDISPNRSGAGEPGDTVAYAFVVTNSGALPEAFDLNFTSTLGLAWTLYNDSTAHPQGPPVTTTGTLSGGAHFNVVATAIIPVVAVDQTVDYTAFRVQSVVNPDNFKTATGSTTIRVPVISLVKTATAPDPHSGAEIIYTITYTNIGHGIAFACAVTDSIPANTSYVAGSTTLNGVAKTDVHDADEASADGRSVTVTIGTIGPNEHGVVEFRVRIL